MQTIQSPIMFHLSRYMGLCISCIKAFIPFVVVLLAIVGPSDTGDAGVSVEVL